MKWRRRVRKTVKWGGVVAIVLMGSAAVAGYWYTSVLQYDSIGTESIIYVEGGAIGLNQFGDRSLNLQRRGSLLGWSTRTYGHVPVDRELVWLPLMSGDSTFTKISLPLWIPILLVAALTAFAWRLDARARRRDRVGMCQQCGYNRAGIAVTAPCPECGDTPTVPPVAAPTLTRIN